MIRFLTVCSTMLVLAVPSASACTTIVVGKAASATGRVIVGHTEDTNWSRTVHRFQSGDRYRYFTAAAYTSRPAPSCDSAVNACGVFITMNFGGRSATENLPRGQGVRDEVLHRTAGLAGNAREGAENVRRMLEASGLRDGGWIWTVADAQEAWVVEGVNGRAFVMCRVPDDAVAVIPNVLTVREIPPDAIRGSAVAADVEDFSRRYQTADWFMHAHSVSRYRQAADILTDGQWNGKVEFSLKPAKRVDAATVRGILSSHVRTGFDVHVDDVGPICRHATLEALVAVLSDRPEDCALQLAFGSPCTYPWIAVEPFGGNVPDGLLAESPNAWDLIHASIARISSVPRRLLDWKRVKLEKERSCGGCLTVDDAVAFTRAYVSKLDTLELYSDVLDRGAK